MQRPDFSVVTCARIPKSCAVLCSRGLWPSFGVADLFRSPSLFRGWSIAASPQIWEAARYPHQRFAAEDEPGNLVDPAASQEFLADVRGLAAALQRALPEQNIQPLLRRAHVLASSFQRHIYETNAAYRIGDAPRAGNEAYNIHYLINCFLLSDILKSDENLKRTLELACKIVLPAHMCEVVLKLFKEGDRPVPSKSTISRLRLKLDVAAMLQTRGWLQAYLQNPAAPGVVTHAMADSSPQGGHDYELVSLCVIPKENLASLHVEVMKLLASRSKSLPDREEWLAEERDIMERIRSMMRNLTPPPVLLGIGKGRSTLPLKFQAVIHSMFLVTGAGKELERFSRSIETWVSDLGTESGFAKVRKLPLRSLLPYLQPSNDGAGANASGLEVDFAADGNEEVDFAADDASSNPDVSIDVEGSLTIPGFLHILHNCFSGLCDCLPQFASVVGQLGQVANLIGRPESKERLLRTCFQTALGEALSADIKEYNDFVYDKRWGTVSHCIVSLLRCKAALRRMWSLEAFLAGGRLEDDHDMAVADDLPAETVNLRSADEAIHSSFWWQYLDMVAKFAQLQNILTAWCESCACHWDLFHEDSVPIRLKQLWNSCPLRGRRCVELASGEFWTFVQRPVSGQSCVLSRLMSACIELRAYPVVWSL